MAHRTANNGMRDFQFNVYFKEKCLILKKYQNKKCENTSQSFNITTLYDPY